MPLDDHFPPLIDLDDPDAPTAIDDACRRIGFFQITGHGVDPKLIEATFAAADAFFRQNVEEKSRWVPDNPDIERGYAAKGTEGLAYTLGMERPPDLFEAFTYGLEPVPDAPAFHTDEHYSFSDNIWPDTVPSMRDAMLDYYYEARRVSHRVTRLMAISLGIDEDFFEAFTDESTDTIRVNWFEGAPGDRALPDQFGIGPHSDFGMCTLLLCDQEPALQVFVDDEWRFVVPVPGALIVNAGDLLARWTNDRWRSTLHRVIPMIPTGPDSRIRRSIPFFHEGNHDALVETIPTCIDRDHPQKYEPIKGGDNVQEKLKASRQLYLSSAESTLGDRVGALT